VFARDGAEVTADGRTNSLIVRGDAKTVARVDALLLQFDVPDAAPAPPKPKR
jgi:type II secretory pathway component GspD/PulD (secretin)